VRKDLKDFRTTFTHLIQAKLMGAKELLLLLESYISKMKKKEDM
jgi:hypothetical protein